MHFVERGCESGINDPSAAGAFSFNLGIAHGILPGFHMRLLDRFPNLLLDMNRTFMFGEDRFGPDEDYWNTYQQAGGGRLDTAALREILQRTYAGMMRDYNDPAKFNAFPSLQEGLRIHGLAPTEELGGLERTFELHECGSVPSDHADCLRRLKETHRLGLVSNIWSRKEVWLQALDRAGIEEVFACRVFSSDSKHLKPSPVLFEQALRELPARAADTVFIGDSLERDMKPAKRLGMTTVWISREPIENPWVDYAIPSLLKLECLEGKAKG